MRLKLLNQLQANPLIQQVQDEDSNVFVIANVQPLSRSHFLTAQAAGYSTKTCLCGSEGFTLVRSQQLKICNACNMHLLWPLNEGQKPLT